MWWIQKRSIFPCQNKGIGQHFPIWNIPQYSEVTNSINQTFWKKVWYTLSNVELRIFFCVRDNCLRISLIGHVPLLVIVGKILIEV